MRFSASFEGWISEDVELPCVTRMEQIRIKHDHAVGTDICSNSSFLDAHSKNLPN